jgi:hypothetical protein
MEGHSSSSFTACFFTTGASSRGAAVVFLGEGSLLSGTFGAGAALAFGRGCVRVTTGSGFTICGAVVTAGAGSGALEKENV